MSDPLHETPYEPIPIDECKRRLLFEANESRIPGYYKHLWTYAVKYLPEEELGRLFNDMSKAAMEAKWPEGSWAHMAERMYKALFTSDIPYFRMNILIGVKKSHEKTFGKFRKRILRKTFS